MRTGIMFSPKFARRDTDGWLSTGRVVDIGDLGEDPEKWHGPVEVIVDKFVIRREIEKQLKVAVGNALAIGERFLSVCIVQSPAD
jgi:hypothetical protein